LAQIWSASRRFTIEFVVDDGLESYGTASVLQAVLRAKPQLSGHVAVLMGDVFCYRPDGGSDLAELLTALRRGGYKHGLLAAQLPDEEVENKGIFEVDERSHLVRIREKPSRHEVTSRLGNASRYVFDVSALRPVLAAYVAGPRDGEYLLTDVVENLAAKQPVLVQKLSGDWLDAGTPAGLYKCWQYLAPLVA
jgi:UTP-glucose-1-phosphate uridylyltransferase